MKTSVVKLRHNVFKEVHEVASGADVAAAEVQKFVENSTKPLPAKDLYEIELP